MPALLAEPHDDDVGQASVCEAVLEPHSGHVLLDKYQHNLRWYLINSPTCERHMLLRSGAYELVFDAESFGTLFDGVGSEQSVDDVLKVGLYRGGGGGGMISTSHPAMTQVRFFRKRPAGDGGHVGRRSSWGRGRNSPTSTSPAS